MAGVRTETIRREGGSQVIVDFTLQTSLGPFPVELRKMGGIYGNIGRLPFKN